MSVHRAPALAGLLYVAALVLAGCAPSAEPGEPPGPALAEFPGLVVRSYGIRDFLRPWWDYPSGPPPSVVQPVTVEPSPRVSLFEDVEPPEWAPEEEAAERLTALIERTVRSSEPWESAGGRASMAVDVVRGTLLVRQTPEGHESLAELLTELRRERAIMICVEARFVGMSREDTATLSRRVVEAIEPPPQFWGPGNSGGNFAQEWLDLDSWYSMAASVLGTFLTREQTDQLLAEMEKLGSATVRFAPRLTLWNGQRSWISDGVMHRLTIEQVDAPDSTRQVADFLSGCILGVRATASADRRYVQLDLRPEVAGLHNSYPTTVRLAGGDERIALPRVQLTNLSTSVSVPDRQTLVMRFALRDERLVGVHLAKTEGGQEVLSPVWQPVTGGAAGAKTQRFLWLLVRPTIVPREIDDEPPPEPGAAESR